MNFHVECFKQSGHGCTNLLNEHLREDASEAGGRLSPSLGTCWPQPRVKVTEPNAFYQPPRCVDLPEGVAGHRCARWVAPGKKVPL